MIMYFRMSFTVRFDLESQKILVKSQENFEKSQENLNKKSGKIS